VGAVQLAQCNWAGCEVICTQARKTFTFQRKLKINKKTKQLFLRKYKTFPTLRYRSKK
jgi:hypothetical protein